MSYTQSLVAIRSAEERFNQVDPSTSAESIVVDRETGAGIPHCRVGIYDGTDWIPGAPIPHENLVLTTDGEGKLTFPDAQPPQFTLLMLRATGYLDTPIHLTSLRFKTTSNLGIRVRMSRRAKLRLAIPGATARDKAYCWAVPWDDAILTASDRALEAIGSQVSSGTLLGWTNAWTEDARSADAPTLIVPSGAPLAVIIRLDSGSTAGRTVVNRTPVKASVNSEVEAVWLNDLSK